MFRPQIRKEPETAIAGAARRANDSGTVHGDKSSKTNEFTAITPPIRIESPKAQPPEWNPSHWTG